MSSTATTTILEQVQRAFNFNVRKQPLFGPDALATPLSGLFRDDTWELVGHASVRDRYKPHTTDDVLALVEAAQTAFEGMTARTHFSHGHYVTLEPSRDQRVQLCKADTIFPRMMIRAGYDGNAFKVSLGYYRDICANLSIMRAVKSCHYSVVHSGDMRGKMDSMVKRFEGVKNGWEDLLTMIGRMNETRVNMVEFLDQIYGQPKEIEGRSVTIHKNRTEAIFKRLARELSANGLDLPNSSNGMAVPAWYAYNAIQGYVQHDATRRGANAKNDYDRIISAANDRNVHMAETLAVAALAA